jgi:flagellar motor switch protein FliG
MAMELSGKAKAAILLLSLDEARAVNIIQHLDEEELRSLRGAIDNIGQVNAEILETVYVEFARAYKSGLSSISGGTSYLHDLVAKARGEEEAVRVFALPPPTPDEGAPPMSMLDDADPMLLSAALADEHPQVVAAVLAHLPPQLASKILADKEVEERSAVVRRIASLRQIPEDAIRDVAEAIASFGLTIGRVGAIDGVQSAATILNAMVGESATEVLDSLGAQHPDEADSIRRAMFTFENLVDADIRGLQAMLREVQSDSLLVALKTASEAVKERIFSCMSGRAAEMLRDELEVMGPARLADVEESQQQIVDLAMRLMSEGKLSVAGRGETMV